jgi:acyl dehydratase/CBS domain-containing protein
MLAPISIDEVMHSPVETVGPGVTAREAATRLFEEGIGSLVVCEDGDPVGIVTDVDVTRLVSAGRDPETTSVAEFMSESLVTIDADAGIEDAAAKMREHGIKRLPVVESGAVVGIATTTDLSNYLPHLVRMGRGETVAEAPERRPGRADTAYEREDWTFETTADGDLGVGDGVSFAKTVSEADVEAFAQASGDTNRLHLDEEYAAGTRFGRRIAHGTLVAGIISAALARLPGMVVYLSQDTSYLGPVDVGDRVTAECTVVEQVGESRYRLTTEATVDGETVVDGEAVVLVDPLPDE